MFIMIFWIINKIILSYIISTVAFLLLIIFFKSFRRRTSIYLNKENFLIVFVLLLNIIWTGEQTIKCLVSKSNSNSFSADILINGNRHCATIFIGTFLFAFLFQSLFFFNRHRGKVIFTIISILLLTFFYNYERLIIFITSLYRDYLPSSWSTYYDSAGAFWTIVFAVLYFAFCWTNRLTLKSKKIASK